MATKLVLLVVSTSVSSTFINRHEFYTFYDLAFISHRFPDAHNCESIRTKVPPPTRSTHPAPTFRLPTRKPPSDPVKFLQWQKVELMKMRHRASPGDPKDKTNSVPIEQRLHIKIVSENKEHVFWFRKVWKFCISKPFYLHCLQGCCNWTCFGSFSLATQVILPQKSGKRDVNCVSI